LGLVGGESSFSISLSIDELESAWRGEISTSPIGATSLSPLRADAKQQAPTITTRPRVLILHARGSNRDHDAATACGLAGGEPEIVTVCQLVNKERSLLDYNMLIIPGGFSFGDDLGAGVLLATTLNESLGEDMWQFVASGRPVIGVCNGFQALVKAGLLPGEGFGTGSQRSVTLTYNESGRFECRWVYLKPNIASPSIFLQGMDDLIYCPVAHGEGRVAASDSAAAAQLASENLIALTYTDACGDPVGYPGNPNGSVIGIAGLTNPQGNVLGLMPHPENHIYSWQHPNWRRGERGMSGLRLFENAIRYAAK